MKRIPPSVQVRQALTESLEAWFAGHPLRQFVAREDELMLQVDGGIWSFAYTLTAGVLTETRLTNLRGHVTTYRFNTRGYRRSAAASLCSGRRGGAGAGGGGARRAIPSRMHHEIRPRRVEASQ